MPDMSTLVGDGCADHMLLSLLRPGETTSSPLKAIPTSLLS